MTSSDLAASLQIIEVKPGVRFSKAQLQQLLPDVETLLFFSKLYELSTRDLSYLLATLFQSDVVRALTEGSHSLDLQDYLVDMCDEFNVDPGDVDCNPDVPKGEILPELWKALEVEVAQSIKDVAAKLQSAIGLMPGKQGSMVFNSMMQLNKRRPTIGDYRARIHHAPEKQNLLILDVSGSMSEATIHAIVDDVVALSYLANAHLAIVSNTTIHWEPGTYSTEAVLRSAQYGGTHYETLADLMQENWGVVITVADYDSSRSAKESLALNCSGHIDTLFDVSLVDRPTFLAECAGQFADEVRPLLVAQHSLCE